MDKLGSENIRKSRADHIKEARESCTRNLNPAAKAHRRSPTRSNDPSSNTYKKKGFSSWDYSKKGPLKAVLIRVACAFAIFITVITINLLDSKYKTDYGNKISTYVTSNVSIEKAQDILVTILEKINK